MKGLKLSTIRLLIADDVGIGKTIEAGLITKELLDRGEIDRFSVICPPHLCEQWQKELSEKFSIESEVVRTGSAARLERGLRPDESVFQVYPFTVVSLDYIKSDRRRDDFMRSCPNFVIIDEAHTCVRANSNTRHQRYQLLKGLSEGDCERDMILLTATPHSGDDVAFHNLLGLLNPKFSRLADMPEGDKRNQLREELAQHFVQRRRGDISEWKDSVGFPIRESREATYQLNGDWGELFARVLAYARTMIKNAEKGSMLQQRMSWWAALALLRCVSSSPAAASMALRTRLVAAESETENSRLERLNQMAADTVMDESSEDSLSSIESVPAGTVQAMEDSEELEQLISETDKLRGLTNDPKLNLLITELKKLLNSKFRPVVFCRYIATAHYVGGQLGLALNGKKFHIEVVTGELTPDQREERIESLERIGEDMIPILVATDCLSEGINLQNHFNSIIHYDLTWNPTRHEQREGRVDRFGQASTSVRALMLYGENNPVDGAVLRVILRKADKIRKELGVSVPIPTDNNKVVEAIMEAVLLHKSPIDGPVQTEIDLGDIETQVDDAWQAAKRKMTGTVFAQRRLRPDDVIQEWNKAISVLGGSKDVMRFVQMSAQHLGASLTERDGYHQLPVAHFPNPLQDRLEAVGLVGSARITFKQPAPLSVNYIHRAHPLVAILADYITEQALEQGSQNAVARSTAIYTDNVETRTTLHLLRLRYHIQVDYRDSEGQRSPVKSLLSEECIAIAFQGSDDAKLLSEEEVLSLFSLKPDGNMSEGQKTHFVRQALDEITNHREIFARVAHERSQILLQDHRCVRIASDLRGHRYSVKPVLPVDHFGVYILLPKASW